MLGIAPLFSSSKGNCIAITSTCANILIDAGFSCKKTEAELEKIDLSLKDFNGILVTHEHSDHINGIGVISRKYNIPVYANETTWMVIEKKLNVAEANKRIIEEKDFFIKELAITPISTSHDAVAPFCYSISYKGKKISVVTDLGRMTSNILNKISGSDIVFLESNHDEEMVKCCSYPYHTKRRILSTVGHLSNDDSAKASLLLIKSGVRGIILGHLSEQNNVSELAYKTTQNFLEKNGIQVGKHFALSIAKKYENSGYIVL